MSPAEAGIRSVRDAASRLFGRPDSLEPTLKRWDSAFDRLAGRREISIVVPVHDAAVRLEACLDSLAETAPSAELVLVDDRSSEPRVGELYERTLSQRGNAQVVVCERNAGFVASVNSGIRAAGADNDIVLLNSDTVTTSRWLEKLATAAYARERTASVTPLSNAAGIFSLPVEYRDNDLPEGVTPGSCGRVLEEVADREYPSVPVGSGFCLYLRRDALDEIGLFDDFLMHRGYGEENDFCARAESAGFLNLVDDATFVYHERAASFGGWKSGLKERNSRVLKAMHPGHIDRLRAWEEQDPLASVRARYAALLEAGPGVDLSSTSTAVVVRQGPEAADWTDTERTLTIRFDDGRADVDLFGVVSASLAVAKRSRVALVAWLVNRWGGSRVSVDHGSLEDRDLDRLRAALRPDVVQVAEP